jgi:hypothetical protein
MGHPAHIRRRLPDALRRLPSVLKESDAEIDVINRVLPSSLPFPFVFESETCWTYTSGERLIIGALGPAWRGIRAACKEKETAGIISDFMHFAGQYVVRSRMLRIQAGLVLAFDVPCDFRYADSLSRITVNCRSSLSNVERYHREFRHDLPMARIRQSRRLREFSAWVDTLNPLDPLIHRALFQFWRGCALANAGFWEEAVIALDGIASVAREAVQKWHLHPTKPTRGETGAIFAMAVKDQHQLEALYQLRCAFGAHPPLTKWWDFSELYNSEIDAFWEVSGRLIRNLCLRERSTRTVDTNPTSWSDWFVDHAELLFDVAWFAKLPRWPDE